MNILETILSVFMPKPKPVEYTPGFVERMQDLGQVPKFLRGGKKFSGNAHQRRIMRRAS